MPVQIPKLNRIGPSAPESAGRINVNVPDGTRAVAQTAGMVEKIGANVVNHFAEQERAEIERVSTTAGMEFEGAYKAGLREAQNIKGDPTQAYINFDSKIKDLEAAIMERYKDADSRTKAAISDRLLKIRALNYDTRLVNESAQQAAYDKETTDANIKLRKESAMSAVETINMADPESIAKFESHLNDIKDTLFGFGERRGYMEPGPDGSKVPSKMLQYEIKAQMSDVLASAARTLQNTPGMIDQADAFMKRYGDQILGDTKTKLFKSGEDARAGEEGFLASMKVRNLPNEAAYAALDKMKLSPKAREKAEGYIHAYKYRMDADKVRADKETLNELTTYVVKNRDKFATGFELREDPVIKEALDKERISGKQLVALEKLAIKPPTESKPETKQELYNMLFDKTLKDLEPGEIAQKLADLDRRDRNFFEARWRADREETDKEKSTMIRHMGKELESRLRDAKVIKAGKRNGKLTGEQLRKYHQWQDELMANIEEYPPGTDPMAQRKYVKEFVETRLKNEIYAPQSQKKKLPRVETPSAREEKPATKNLSKDEIDAKLGEFFDKYKRTPKNKAEFDQFIKAGE